VEEFEADQGAADREKGFVDVVSALVADAEPAVLVEPRDRPFHDPPLFAESGAVFALGPGDPRLDAAFAELPPALAGVVGTVAQQPLRTSPRPATTP